MKKVINFEDKTKEIEVNGKVFKILPRTQERCDNLLEFETKLTNDKNITEIDFYANCIDIMLGKGSFAKIFGKNKKTVPLDYAYTVYSYCGELYNDALFNEIKAAAERRKVSAQIE